MVMVCRPKHPVQGCRKASGDCARKRRKSRSASGVKVHAGKNGLIHQQQNQKKSWRWKDEAYCKFQRREGFLCNADQDDRRRDAD